MESAPTASARPAATTERTGSGAPETSASAPNGTEPTGTAGHGHSLIWAPRRQVTLAQARKRSDIVRVLRMVFTYGAAASIGLLAGYLIQSAFQGSDGRRSFQSNEIVTMINPRFTGRDSAGQAYVITAESAQRRRGQDGIVDLTNPRMIDEAGTRVTAPEGTYDLNAVTLDLYRDVQVAEASGYIFSSTSARFHVNDGRVEGVDPLRGVGPLGDIRSDTYQITEDGSVMTFLGNVEMTFYPDDPPPPPLADPAADPVAETVSDPAADPLPGGEETLGLQEDQNG
ncbi:MAG: LPS export ABC transporter periplasmic protein LptC [Pseudomonadota bacterium]